MKFVRLYRQICTPIRGNDPRIFTRIYGEIIYRYTTVCPSVRGDNPLAKNRGYNQRSLYAGTGR